jgi:hypothetical protein
LLFFLNIFSFRYSHQKVLSNSEAHAEKDTNTKTLLRKSASIERERDEKIVLGVKNSGFNKAERRSEERRRYFFDQKSFRLKKFWSFFCLLSRFLFFTDWTDAISRIVTDS